MKHDEMKQEPVAWINEDELPESYPYDVMFPYSKVDVVRMFPVFEPQLKHDDGRTDALRDLSYCAGLKAGWNFCVANDHIGFEQAQNCMSEALKVLKHTTPQQPKPLTDEQKEIINFLLGASDIDDVWFGDKHPTEKGQFWWRNRLRKAFQEAAHGIKE